MGPNTADPRHRDASPEEPLAARFERAHRRILEFLVKELLEARDLDRIRTLLDGLPELLSEHFAEEEGPRGLYDELRALRPSVDARLESLRLEHREMLEAVEALRREVRKVRSLEEPEQVEQHLARIRRSTSEFLEMVRRHELIETRLVADTYYTEDGGSG